MAEGESAGAVYDRDGWAQSVTDTNWLAGRRNKEGRRKGSKEREEVVIYYEAHEVGRHRLDMIVEGTILVELKTVKNFEDAHFAVARSHLHCIERKHGLLLNFAKPTLEVKRVIYDPAYVGGREEELE